jgi:hypothetical protein
MVVVIGPRWKDARLHDPWDAVRLEVAAALARAVPVLPVLVDGAGMPRPGDLPDDLRRLGRLQAVEVRERFFEQDAEAVLAAVQHLLSRPASPAGADQPDDVVTEGSPAGADPRPGERRPVLLLVEGRRHRELFHVLGDVLARRNYRPVAPDHFMKTERALPQMQALLASVRFVIVDLAIPDPPARAWQAALERQPAIPVVPVLAAGETPPVPWSEMQRQARVLPVVTYASHDELAARIDDAIVTPAERLIESRRRAETGAGMWGISVFVSSTTDDLRAHREAVVRGLRQLGIHAILLEDFGPADTRPLAQLRVLAGRADVFVLILGWRSGRVPDDPNLNPGRRSVMELEYRAARELGKPCLVFLLEEDVPVGPAQTDAWSGRGERILAFREELQKLHTVGYFQGSTDLVDRVTAAVKRWYDGRDRPSSAGQELA